VSSKKTTPEGGKPLKESDNEMKRRAKFLNDNLKSFFEYCVENNRGNPIALQAMQAALRDD